jgi:glutamyl-tRNA(Gln) amidotransferase subunit D
MPKEKEANAGDRVKIVAKDSDYEGVLMPEEKEFLVLKLDSGYNVGILKANVKEIKLLAGQKAAAKQEIKPLPKRALPKLSILHTGGTIASKVDYSTGAVVARFSPEELSAMFPELGEIANISSRLISNMFSEDMRFSHYNIIAKEIEKEIEAGAQAVIVTHGTDTLHYTSAALAFMLQNLPIPVILVGSQRSSDRPSTDSALNLVSAAFFATRSDFAGVAVCMHESVNDDHCLILPATKCRKMHSSRRDAFKAINTLPVAHIDFAERKIEFLSKNYAKKSNNKPKISQIKENLKMGVVKAHPNMLSQEISTYKGFDGLVIEGTGLGHLPINDIDSATKEHLKIFDAVKELIKAGTAVAMASQTIYGGIDMNVYATGRKLIEAGIIGNYCDMTPETAFIKLAWVLSNCPKEKAKEMFEKNIAGEISERLEKVAEK